MIPNWSDDQNEELLVGECTNIGTKTAPMSDEWWSGLMITWCVVWHSY